MPGGLAGRRATILAMPTQDRILLSLAGVSGCVSVWLVFQSTTQWTLRPTASLSNLVFLAVVTGTIVIILLAKKPAVSQRTSGRVRVNRRPLLVFGALAAFLLFVLTTVSDQVQDPGTESIVMPAEASLAGFAGLGVLLLLLRLMWQRVRAEQDVELAPGPLPDGRHTEEPPTI